MKPDINKRSLIPIIHLLEGSALSLLISGILIAIGAYFMLSGKMTGNTERIFVNAVRILSCFSGGFFCGRKNKKRGFLWGLLAGLLYFLVLMLLRPLAGASLLTDTFKIATVLITCLASGMLGGMCS